MIKFPFERRRSKFIGEILKLVIPVKIIGPKKSVRLSMLLDSGADLSVIPYSVGKIIGLKLDMETRGEFQGIGEGTVPYIMSKVTIIIGNITIPTRIAWALIEEVPLILGRLDIFENLSIEFREFENSIIMEQAMR